MTYSGSFYRLRFFKPAGVEIVRVSDGVSIHLQGQDETYLRHCVDTLETIVYPSGSFLTMEEHLDCALGAYFDMVCDPTKGA